MSSKENSENQDLDWENRVLCSDESCIGIIGPDGLCKECGKPYQGDLPFASAKDPDTPATPTQPTEPDVPQAEQDASNDTTTDPPGPEDADDEWARRKLCSDESCIGVIGPDSRCKECGKPFEG